MFNHKTDIIGKSMFAESKNRINGSVEIEDDVWMGANVTILPNVVITEGCVIGAGSIITKNLPPYSICVGIPCKPIKRRFSEQDLKTHLDTIEYSKYTVDKIIEGWQRFNL